MPRDLVKPIWDELTDVAYVSPQPGITYRFGPPQAPRVDNDPTFNNQPWYHGSNFPGVSSPRAPELTKKAVKK